MSTEKRLPLQAGAAEQGRGSSLATHHLRPSCQLYCSSRQALLESPTSYYNLRTTYNRYNTAYSAYIPTYLLRTPPS